MIFALISYSNLIFDNKLGLNDSPNIFAYFSTFSSSSS